jgi:hypothetical protein
LRVPARVYKMDVGHAAGPVSPIRGAAVAPSEAQSKPLERRMPKTVDDLIAESAIKDVHIRYCRANDRRDEEMMRGCFHPDAVIELHEPLDVEAFIALGRQVLSQFTVTWHNTGNQLVEVEGDLAWAEHYTIGLRPTRLGRSVISWRQDATWTAWSAAAASGGSQGASCCSTSAAWTRFSPARQRSALGRAHEIGATRRTLCA